MEVSISLLPVFLAQPDVLDQLMSFFLTVFSSLKSQVWCVCVRVCVYVHGCVCAWVFVHVCVCMWVCAWVWLYDYVVCFGKYVNILVI